MCCQIGRCFSSHRTSGRATLVLLFCAPRARRDNVSTLGPFVRLSVCDYALRINTGASPGVFNSQEDLLKGGLSRLALLSEIAR